MEGATLGFTHGKACTNAVQTYILFHSNLIGVEKGEIMECIGPSEHVDEDITAENIGYCELHPECCETISSNEVNKRQRWLTRLLKMVFPGWGQ